MEQRAETYAEDIVTKMLGHIDFNTDELKDFRKSVVENNKQVYLKIGKTEAEIAINRFMDRAERWLRDNTITRKHGKEPSCDTYFYTQDEMIGNFLEYMQSYEYEG